MTKCLHIFNLCSQLTKYSEGLALQALLADRRKSGTFPDSLLLLQHHPVYTLGKRGQEQDFKVSVQELLSRGIDIEAAPRGGEITYHGPGQLVAYPILNLRGLGLGARAYVEGLEDTIVRLLARYGVPGHGREPGATGVWVGNNKIAAIGVKISHGISSHGFALNVGGPSLLPAFDAIVPCGIEDVGRGVTSLEAELQSVSFGPSFQAEQAQDTMPEDPLRAFSESAYISECHGNSGKYNACYTISQGVGINAARECSNSSWPSFIEDDTSSADQACRTQGSAALGRRLSTAKVANLMILDFCKQFQFNDVVHQTCRPPLR